MEDYIISDLTGKSYIARDVVRIVNWKQAAYYWSNGVTPLDIYPSTDYRTDKPIFVFIFNRSMTKEVYDKWCKEGENKAYGKDNN